MEKYIKQSQLSKYKITYDYPNPIIKMGVDKYGIEHKLHIIDDNQKIVVSKMSSHESLNFLGKVCKDGDYTMVSIGNHFPTDLVCSVVAGRYSDKSDLAIKTGWTMSSGSMGTANDAFLTSKVDVALKILQETGFELDLIKNNINDIVFHSYCKARKIGFARPSISIDVEEGKANFSYFGTNDGTKPIDYNNPIMKALLEIEPNVVQLIKNIEKDIWKYYLENKIN